METGAVVVVEQLWKFFGDYAALRNVSLSVAPGECLALLGRNGAGKTTLLRILAGLSRPAKGRAVILGAAEPSVATRRRIGVLQHGIGIYDELSALENLTLFARLYGIPKPAATANEWLDRVGLSSVKDGRPREFSRGMRQRLAVARAFLHRPDLYILDEPFTALDDRAIALLQQLLNDALREGRTVIMSTHQLREALELATNVALITRGAVAFAGPRTAEMLSDPGWIYRNYGEA